MLKVLRVTVSAVVFTLITLYFLDFAGWMPDAFHVLAHIQLVPALLSLSLGILVLLVVLTLLLGRVYCSSLCPMGVFQDIVGRVSRPFKSKKQRKFKYARPKTILRWSVVGVTALAFLAGIPVILGLLDPYSAYGRMMVDVAQPAYMAGNNLLEKIFTGFDNYTFYKVKVFLPSIFSFAIGLLTFIAIGYLAWRHGRSWCNTVCPVGTALGFLSRFSLLKVRIDGQNCTRCGRCAGSCKASCIDVKNYRVDNSRCVACFNCLKTCRDNAISYKLPKSAPPEETDGSRRRFLSAGVAAALVAPRAAKAQVDTILTGKSHYKREHPITPPGSAGRENLLKHCTSCHLCVSKCPANIIKPAFMEYGFGGIMQPTLSFERGFCNYDCTICGEICPNNAIKPLTVEEKHRTQTGYVVFLKENCIVYTDETSCGACSEHCPTQAIAMKPYKDMLTLPKIDTGICVGCGGCEYVCPTSPKAVYIEGNPVHKEALPFHDPDKQDFDLDGFGF